MTDEQKKDILALLEAHTTHSVTEDANFEDLGFDSLDIADIQMELEDLLDLTITDQTMKEVKSFKDIEKLLVPVEK